MTVKKITKNIFSACFSSIKAFLIFFFFNFWQNHNFACHVGETLRNVHENI